MSFSIFRNKWFWIVWLILSLTGAIIGLALSNNEANKLEKASDAICIEFREVPYPSIWGIPDLKFADEYIRVMLDTNIRTHNIQGTTVVENYQEVKILDYSVDSSLVKIAITKEQSKRTRPRYEETWVLENFIRQK